ncbi:uncharacterized protein K489DRAFT_321948, partial [Dissoconium aciculare CBS 342.82]|uniref:Heterokaryon incompatibility domain-containing protein n=1 Tax=Dissoconium aciculare CBS 342.82 TaxID=1314786 RepID=A0A6J3M2T6_9PEZI
MRLINVQTLQLTEFLDARQRPKYVIASHRWAPDESSFKDLRKGRNKHYSGYKKIDGFAQYIRQSYPAIEWLWIDTCCVNKESDAELSYAINSMFDWYRNAEVCVARLGILPSNYTPEQLKQDQWFWRGWTLQELLAPRVVVFVDHDWRAIGHKGIGSQGTGPNIAKAIASITGISEAVLGDWGASVNLRLEEKMKWMTNRDTTREEDMIYALFGIVGVSMSVIYGEGKDRASARLVAAI